MKRHDASLVAAAVGRAVRARRKKIGRTSYEVALGANIDRTYMSQLERGLRQPTINIFIKLAAQLHIKPEGLLRRVVSELGRPVPSQ